MLSVQFHLSTAQTKMLIAIAYGNWEDELVLPSYKRPNVQNDFVGVARRLIERGLVSHHEDTPAYRITPAGRALADMIVDECEHAVNLRRTESQRAKTWAPVIEAANRHKINRKHSHRA